MIAPLDQSPEDIAVLCAPAPPAVAALIVALLDRVADQAATIAILTARVQELEDQASRTSRTSHQPPASDGLKKQPRSLRERSGKLPGDQPGHPGHTLTFADHPDQTVRHRPTHCAECGHPFEGVPAQECQRRQVVDLPPLQLVTTAHQVETLACPHCHATTSGEFPPEAAEPVQYGPRVQALAVYLRTDQLLPSARTQELFADLFGTAPSEGTLARILTAAAQAVAPVVERIRAARTAAPVAHFDETGCYVEDKRYWLHVARTARWTYYTVQVKRGQEGSTAAGVLPNFGGSAVHDGYASYGEYECRHALCGAHRLRELRFLVERYGQGWAAEMADLLRAMLAATETAREAEARGLPAEQVAEFERQYQAVVAAGSAANPVVPRPAEQERGRVKQSPAPNLLLRLRDHAAEVLRFLHDLRVPFDNNQAERDIRMMKVQQKISGRFRSREGAAEFCQIRSYISTMRKQGAHVFLALEQVCRGTPLLPDLKA